MWNAVNSHVPPYYRPDPSVKKAIDEKFNQGWSTEKIYGNLTKSESTLLETIKNTKVIDNRKYTHKEKSKDISGKQSEAEIIVNYLKEDDTFVKSLNLNKDEYNTLNFIQEQLWDVYRLCVKGNSILSIDITFEICEGLYLTDSTYQNLSLVDEYGKHPEFPGPSFWHFRKTEETYRRFAGELLIAELLLLGIKKIGHDLHLLKVSLALFLFREDLCALFIQVSDISEVWIVNSIRLKQLVIFGINLRKLMSAK